jgi:hypothetical protein
VDGRGGRSFCIAWHKKRGGSGRADRFFFLFGPGGDISTSICEHVVSKILQEDAQLLY